MADYDISGNPPKLSISGMIGDLHIYSQSPKGDKNHKKNVDSIFYDPNFKVCSSGTEK